MTSILKNNKLLALSLGCAMILLSACNKDLDQFPEAAKTVTTAATIGDNMKATPRDILFYSLVQRAGLLDTLNQRAKTFTVFVPDTTAIKGFLAAATSQPSLATAPNSAVSAFILNSFPAANANAIVNYNIIPQTFTTFPTNFPNIYLPSLFNPAPSVSAFLRLDLYLSQNNNNKYVNNIPVVAANIATGNGVIHHTAALAIPPSQYLWDRIKTDADLTYLKAAILRADSGTTNVPGTLNQSILQSVLSNIGPDLTILAPSNAAFVTTLTGAIYQALVKLGYPAGAGTLATATSLATATDANGPTVFRNPALYAALTAQTVKGIIVYHVLGARAFTNNFPTTVTNVPTLLNTVIPSHPGVGLQCVFSGPNPIATAATVKGAYNATAANVIINNTTAPYGTSDQIYLNGVIHKIDQVLIPLPL